MGGCDMGKLRARTGAEFEARRQEILTAAGELLMAESYEDITLATIAERTSISRPSMYNYYEKKELVFADLMILEYRRWEEDLRKTFTMKQPREAFCKTMTELLWERHLLLKLLSLQLTVWDHKYDDEVIVRFEEEVQPFFQTLGDVLRIQFPDADSGARDMFRIQFTVYCNSLYLLDHLPASQLNAMNDLNLFGKIPSGKDICYEGLMLLSAGLVCKSAGK